MIEFSKLMVVLLCVFWFAGGLFGMVIGAYAVKTEITTVDTVFNFLQLYIGAPFGATIIGYLGKSAFEKGSRNLHKLDKNGIPHVLQQPILEQEETTDDI